MQVDITPPYNHGQAYQQFESNKDISYGIAKEVGSVLLGCVRTHRWGLQRVWAETNKRKTPRHAHKISADANQFIRGMHSLIDPPEFSTENAGIRNAVAECFRRAHPL